MCENVLSPRSQRCKRANLGGGGKHRRSVYGIDQGVGVAEGKLPFLSIWLHEQEIRSQPLDDARDLLGGAPTYRHERDDGRHADNDPKQRESGPKLVGRERRNCSLDGLEW